MKINRAPLRTFPVPYLCAAWDDRKKGYHPEVFRRFGLFGFNPAGFRVHQPYRVQHGPAGYEKDKRMGSFRQRERKNAEDIKKHKEPERDGDTPAIRLLAPDCEEYRNNRDRHFGHHSG